MAATAEAATAAGASGFDPEVFMLPLDEIHPAPDNPRQDVGDVVELAMSIKSLGLLEPIVVTPRSGDVCKPDGYLIVCGARRYAAVQTLGLDRVPSIVRAFDERGRVEAMLVENLQREGLTVLEEARAYDRLAKLGLKQRELAERVGKSQPHISKRLALLGLPQQALKLVDSGGISLEDAQHLLKLRDHPKRLKAAVAAVQSETKRGWQPDVEHVVRAELDEVELDEKLAKTRTELETAGIRIVELQGNSWSLRPPTGMKFVKEYAYDERFEVQMKPARHAKLDCRAAALGPNGSVYEVCTDPSQHKPKPDSKAAAAKQKEKAHAKALREARKARVEFIRGLLAKPPGAKDDLIVLIAKRLIREAWDSKRKLACELLGIEPLERETETPYRDGHTVALDEHAEKRGGALAVGLAIDLAASEEDVKQSLYGGGFKRHADYFERLKQLGYEISEAEQRELGAKDA